MNQRSNSGASRDAIRAHYDVGNEFYSLWLDPSMTYSCGLWEGVDTLEAAQSKKLDFHIDNARAGSGSRTLDVGCGWGSLLRRLESRKAESIVGITLSAAQADYVRSLQLPRVSVVLEDWRDHRALNHYDAIISIGALEHFVRPEMDADQRISVYSEFFSRAAEWLRSGGWMSLQTIAYGSGDFTHGAISSIFPESDLPRLSELVEAIRGKFELISLRNDREDYARTCRSWLERLVSNRDAAVAVVGEKTCRHYEAFLDASARGFDVGIFVLLRLQLRRLDGRYKDPTE